MNLGRYMAMTRIDNWPKNLLIFIGVALAFSIKPKPMAINITSCLIAFMMLCFTSSANYVLNEYNDGDSDKYHPWKKKRSMVSFTLNKTGVFFVYLFLLMLTITLSVFVDESIRYILVIYVILAWLYNVKPIRLKDRAYVDVLCESMNYPIRVVIGWLCVLPGYLPPSSIILTSLAAGGFAMSMKRVAELQLFTSDEQAVAYRQSYASYTLHSLIVSGFIYALLTIMGLTILMLKYPLIF